MLMPTERNRTAAEACDVSFNVIVNSAMAQWPPKRGLVEIR